MKSVRDVLKDLYINANTQLDPISLIDTAMQEIESFLPSEEEIREVIENEIGNHTASSWVLAEAIHELMVKKINQ